MLRHERLYLHLRQNSIRRHPKMGLSLAMSGLPGERIDCPAPLKLFESLQNLDIPRAGIFSLCLTILG